MKITEERKKEIDFLAGLIRQEAGFVGATLTEAQAAAIAVTLLTCGYNKFEIVEGEE